MFPVCLTIVSRPLVGRLFNTESWMFFFAWVGIQKLGDSTKTDMSESDILANCLLALSLFRSPRTSMAKAEAGRVMMARSIPLMISSRKPPPGCVARRRLP